MVVNRKDTDRKIPRDRNTSISPSRLTPPVRISGGTSVSPTRKSRKEISIPSGPIGPVEVRNTQPFHTSIHGNSSEQGDPAPTFSKVIGRKISNYSRYDIYSRCRMKFTLGSVLTKIPNFMNLGLSSIHTSDELRPFNIPATIIGRPIDGFNWLLPGNLIYEVTAAIMSRTGSEKN